MLSLQIQRFICYLLFCWAIWDLPILTFLAALVSALLYAYLSGEISVKYAEDHIYLWVLRKLRSKNITVEEFIRD